MGFVLIPFRRKVMEMVIFVANFDKYTEEEDLRVLFSRYGTVTDVKIFRNRDTEEPLGYAFVDMPEDYCAERAIRHLNGGSGTEGDLKSAKDVRVIGMINSQ